MTDDPEQVEDVEAFFTNLPELAAQVEKNKTESVTDRRNLRHILTIVTYLFGFMVVIGLTAGVLLQRQAGDNAATLRETRATAFDQCQIANDNARALNQFLDVAMASVRANGDLRKAEKDYRLSLYSSIKQKLPICEAP